MSRDCINAYVLAFSVGQDPWYSADQMNPAVTSQPFGTMGLPSGAPANVPWMPKPNVVGCPAGLEYLADLDKILVQKQIDLTELLTMYDAENRYRLFNTAGQQVYFASEESNSCERQCCHGNRSFTMHITDNTGMEVIRLQREFQCWKASCWCACSDCCAHSLSIEAPVGTTVGYVRQKCSVCQPIYAIQDYDHNELMTILGPCCITGCSDIEFRVTSATDDQDIGEITKKVHLPMVDALTSADKFGVSFPRSLDIKQKATMIGACFLIDFMFFERPPVRRRRQY